MIFHTTAWQLSLGLVFGFTMPPVLATIEKDDPSVWSSITPHWQFQPSHDLSLSHVRTRLLEQVAQQEEDGNTVLPEQPQDWFVDSMDTDYDGYQQAWRYMGFYTDCSNANPNNNNNEQNGDGGGNCQRYLLWAAYVDLDYEGNGIAEYQFYDTVHNEWDATACESQDNNNAGRRCVPMDCHLPHSQHFQLLGYFKNYDYSDFFEQLFKHEGYCLWNQEDDVLDFMYGNYNSWPQGCTALQNNNNNNNNDDVVYYDLKPIRDGNMTIGLYTDANCQYEYELPEEETVESYLQQQQNNGRQLEQNNNGLLLGDYQTMWNEYMSVYKVCQPCRAYSLQNQQQRRRLEDQNNDNGGGGTFSCYDVAGYTDVNQCMKFRTQTNMEYATINEVYQASMQGSLLLTSSQDGVLLGQSLSTSQQAEEDAALLDQDRKLAKIAFGIFTVGLLAFVMALCWFRSQRNYSQPTLQEPLVSLPSRHDEYDDDDKKQKFYDDEDDDDN